MFTPFGIEFRITPDTIFAIDPTLKESDSNVEEIVKRGPLPCRVLVSIQGVVGHIQIVNLLGERVWESRHSYYGIDTDQIAALGVHQLAIKGCHLPGAGPLSSVGFRGNIIDLGTV